MYQMLVSAVSGFDVLQIVQSFISLFIVIDMIGSIPIIINLRSQGMQISAIRATWLAFLFLIGFFYIGDWVLRLFGVDIESFAVAGSLILFFMALEMTLDVTIFKNAGPTKDATLVPLVFPLLAGSASFTTLLSLRADNASINIIIALILNMVIVYVVVKMAEKVENILGKSGIYVLRKFFGIILLAIAIKMFTANISMLVSSFME